MIQRTNKDAKQDFSVEVIQASFIDYVSALRSVVVQLFCNIHSIQNRYLPKPPLYLPLRFLSSNIHEMGIIENKGTRSLLTTMKTVLPLPVERLTRSIP